MKSNEDILKELAKYDLESDLNNKFPKVWRRLSNNPSLFPLEQPIGLLLGGQPGAGKSFATMEIKERLNNNVLVINGDEFRSYHKHYDDFYQLYGKEASKYTGAFAGKMVEKVRDEAIKQGFNIVIEGTFRTVDTPLKELNNFEQKGYKAEVVVCTCPKELSWESTIKRAEELEASGLQPRYVPKEHHDLVTTNLSKNTLEIFNSGLVSRLKIYSRDGVLFDSLNETANNIEDVIEKELNKFSLKQSFQSNVSSLLIDKLRESSKLPPIKPISVKDLSQIELDLSQSHKLTKAKKFKR